MCCIRSWIASGKDPSPAVTEVGSRITAIQMGAVLAWLSGKVLGQYEAPVPMGQSLRLMLIAPTSFRLPRTWALSSGTFNLGVPSRRDPPRSSPLFHGFSDYFTCRNEDLGRGNRRPRNELLKARAGNYLGGVAGTPWQEGAQALLLSVLSPTQREVFDRISALMTLLEGHADVVMDEVGPEVVPTVASIRLGSTTVANNRERWIRSYAKSLDGREDEAVPEGAAFVRSAIDSVGMAGFNAVWDKPANLPSLAEIAEPADWVKRVHG